MKKTLNKIIEDNFYNKFVYDSKKQLLDPLCSMCRIIELYFRPLGTKFGINEHSITIDMPTENNKNWYNITNYQSYQRYWNADSRENISKLGIVIVRLIEWYIIPTFELAKNKKKINTKNLEASIQFNSSDADEITILWICLDDLTDYFCFALEKLIETYNEGNTVWALQCYINILKNSKKGLYNSSHVPTTVIKNNINFIDYEKIKSLWSLEIIKEIHDLYKKCYTTWITPNKEDNIQINNDNDSKAGSAEMSAINKILIIEDKLSSSEKDKRVESYLNAINVFINRINNDFKDLIIKSTGNM
jgi:hypothetical protein